MVVVLELIGDAQGIGSRMFSTASSSSTSHFKRDTFRTRKPNTSRPPSTHVDFFNKKSGIFIHSFSLVGPLLVFVLTPTGSDSGSTVDTGRVSSNKNIHDILIMDAKSREMRKEYIGKSSAPSRKDVSTVIRSLAVVWFL